MDKHALMTAQRSAMPPGEPPLGMHQYRLEPDGRLVFTGANPGADSILQIEHAALLGKAIETIFPGLANTDIPDIYRQVARDGSPWQTDQICIEYGQITYAFQVHAFQTAPGAMAVIFQDIRARQEMEMSLTRRDAILSAVAFAAEKFLDSGDWKMKIQAVLSRLGTATGASRFYLCENKMTPKGATQANRLYEWTENSSDCKPWLINFNYEAQKFSRWVKILSRGEAIFGLVRDFPEPEKTLLSTHKIRSIAVAPIHVHRQWWGIIGFDDCEEERILSSAEIDALKTAANTIGAAIQRTAADQRIYQNASRAQTMVKAGARLSAELEPHFISTTICQEVKAALQANTACVYLYNDAEKSLEYAGGTNLPEMEAQALPNIPLSTLNLFLHKWGIPLYLRDAQDIFQFFHAPLDQMLKIRTVITWLLLYDHKLLGILNIALEDAARTLSLEEIELLEGLGNQAALAFNNARLYGLEKKRSQEIESLYDLSVHLNSAACTKEALHSALSSVQELLEADAGLVILPDEQKSLLTIPQASGYLSENQGLKTALQEDWFESASENSAPYTARDIRNEGAFITSLKGIEQAGPAVMIPLLSAHQPTGVMMVTRQKGTNGNPFSKVDLRLLQTIGELAGTAVQKNRFFEDSQRRLTFLQSLRAIDIEITSSLNLASTLQVVLDEVISQLHIDAVDILIADPESGALEINAARGFQSEALLRESLARGDHHAEQAAVEKRMIILPDLSQQPSDLAHSKLFTKEGFIAYVALPMFSKRKIKGVMEVYCRQPLELDQEWLEYLETLSGQAAIAIENLTLFDHLQRSNAELMRAYDTTIEGWSTALDLKDAATEGHTLRVAQMTVSLAHAIGLQESELVHARRGAMLHDIGKMGVPDQILRKPGPLDESEWQVMKMHPVYAYQWLSPTEYLHPALDIPYCHHEKWDGSGYPQGLRGEEIPLKARIFSVVDVWDALSSDRPYRQKWPQGRVLDYLREQAGCYFDPQIVPVFMDVLQTQQLVM
jgi:HD-GYP domain-containing protein (c-di-GMP phosphodiesterase class II)